MENTTVTKMDRARVRAYFSDITCGDSCWKAKEEICRCSCGGKNHGIHLRGGNAIRNAKINGYRYELVRVGIYTDLRSEVEQLIRDENVAKGIWKLENGETYAPRYIEQGGWYKTNYVHPTCYNQGGHTYVLKYASLPQCIKWPELEYFQVTNDRERYHANAAILWQRADLSSEVGA
jgi:hypothetical protein